MGKLFEGDMLIGTLGTNNSQLVLFEKIFLILKLMSSRGTLCPFMPEVP